MVVLIYRLTNLTRQAIQRWPRQVALVVIALLVFGAGNAFVAGRFTGGVRPFDPPVRPCLMWGDTYEGVAGPVIRVTRLNADGTANMYQSSDWGLPACEVQP